MDRLKKLKRGGEVDETVPMAPLKTLETASGVFTKYYTAIAACPFRFTRIVPLKKYLSVFANIFDDLNSRAAATSAGAAGAGGGDKVDVSPSAQQIALCLAETQVKDFTAVNTTEMDFVLLSTFILFFLYLCENEVGLGHTTIHITTTLFTSVQRSSMDDNWPVVISIISRKPLQARGAW